MAVLKYLICRKVKVKVKVKVKAKAKAKTMKKIKIEDEECEEGEEAYLIFVIFCTPTHFLGL